MSGKFHIQLKNKNKNQQNQLPHYSEITSAVTDMKQVFAGRLF